MTDIYHDSECLVWQGDNAFRPFIGAVPYLGDRDYLKPGMTEWIGPFPPDTQDTPWQRYQLDGLADVARRAARDGAALLATSVGRYLRLHHLFSGPAKKLSDWKELPIGRRLLIHPEPTCNDMEKARTRAGYLRSRGQGRFATDVDEEGALWVKRLA